LTVINLYYEGIKAQFVVWKHLKLTGFLVECASVKMKVLCNFNCKNRTIELKYPWLFIALNWPEVYNER
jgi:hypothetical protein